MRALLPIAILLTACATQPAPAPLSVNVETCDPAMPVFDVLSKGGGNVQPPKVLRKVEPQSPPYSGTHTVQVESIIDETGRVSAICAATGEPQFIESVVKALRQWTFEPATLDGKPVKVRFSLTTRFNRI